MYLDNKMDLSDLISELVSRLPEHLVIEIVLSQQTRLFDCKACHGQHRVSSGRSINVSEASIGINVTSK